MKKQDDAQALIEAFLAKGGAVKTLDAGKRSRTESEMRLAAEADDEERRMAAVERRFRELKIDPDCPKTRYVRAHDGRVTPL